MKKAFLTAALGGLVLLAAAPAQAQSPIESPEFPSASPEARERASTRREKKQKPLTVAEQQRRDAMSPEDQKQDEQMRILDARAGFGGGTGNTSFNRNGPDRQLDTGRDGGFKVKKYKSKIGTAEQKRGMSHPIGGSNPAGKPLTHKRRKSPNSSRNFQLFSIKAR